jgi:two-component system OmpR family response regulator
MRLLVVDDDRALRDVLRRVLTLAGYDIRLAETGSQALAETATAAPDAVVLDIGLPDIDGLDVCRLLRQEGNRVPVLMLTARDAVRDRVEGLDSGADDYLVKPFALAELHARLRSLHRRGRPERPAVLECGDLRLDPASREVHRAAARIELSAKEFALLEILMRHPGEVISRVELLEHAWDLAYEARSNVVDVYIRRLRERVDRPFGRETIETVRGAGYRLRARR